MQTLTRPNKAAQKIYQLLQSPQFQQNKLPSRKIEEILGSEGFLSVCGIDEAGRGAFAGPLVAAAVILSAKEIAGLDDSKKLTAKQRGSLSLEIKQKARAWSVVSIDIDFINLHGIQEASYHAYKEAISSLQIEADFALLDYYQIPNFQLAQLGIKFGDQISQSIAAASIIAKTHRDELMKQFSTLPEYQMYCFDRHKGYGTKAHRDTINQYGLSPQHRLLYCKNCIK
jgi:ribonuclease HII